MSPSRTRVLYIRVPGETHDAVRELADDLGVSMTDAIALTLRLLLVERVRSQVAEAVLIGSVLDRQAPLAELHSPAG